MVNKSEAKNDQEIKKAFNELTAPLTSMNYNKDQGINQFFNLYILIVSQPSILSKPDESSDNEDYSSSSDDDDDDNDMKEQVKQQLKDKIKVHYELKAKTNISNEMIEAEREVYTKQKPISTHDNTKKRNRKSKNDQNGRKYQCSICQKSYLSAPALASHRKKKHFKNEEKKERGRPKKYVFYHIK